MFSKKSRVVGKTIDYVRRGLFAFGKGNVPRGTIVQVWGQLKIRKYKGGLHKRMGITI